MTATGSQRTVFVTTTLNERGTVDILLRSTHALFPDSPFIVVDADSTDGTRTAARACGPHVHVINVGRVPIGPALLFAWKEAVSMGAEVVVQIDAGCSHDPADAVDMLHLHAHTGADVIVGSRFGRRGKYLRTGTPRSPRWRPWGSRAVAALMSAVTGYRHTDWTSGYRVVTARAVRLLSDAGSYRIGMHGWQAEVLTRAHRLGLTVLESPITYRAGRSSFRWRSAWEVVKLAAREVARRA